MQRASSVSSSLKPFLALQITGPVEEDDFVADALAHVRRLRPVQVFLLGDEPLVRRREIGLLLPEFERLGIEVRLVTPALLPIPQEFRMWDNLQIVVRVDGFRPEHDGRRLPPSYYRVLKNIAGHTVTVHCTIGPPQRLLEFTRFWSSREEVCGICYSLSADATAEISEELAAIRRHYPKVYLTDERGLATVPLGDAPLCNVVDADMPSLGICIGT